MQLQGLGVGVGCRSVNSRALDKFSECQDNMSFHVQKWLDISNDWSVKRERKRKEKRRGEKKEGKKGSYIPSRKFFFK